MLDLLGLKLYNLLNKASQKVQNEEIENAYEDLLTRTFHLNKIEDDTLSAIRKINFARIEFITLQTFTLCGKGRNVRQIYASKAILFLESELELLYTQINKFQSNHSIKDNLSDLNWKISDNDLIELARSFYSANIAFTNGKRTKFIDIVKRLEVFFGMEVKRPHNKVTRISERTDVSPFLDLLKDSYIRDLESRL